MRGDVGKGLKRRERSVANRCFFFLNEEKFIDDILVHCVKTSYMKIAFCSLWCVLGSFLCGCGLRCL